MTSREDFKQAIRTGNINEAFLVAMSNAPELSITTRIITSEGEEHQVNSDRSGADNYLRTNINLIEGKIENEIGEKLTGDRYSEIKQFHMRQVEEGHQTIQHNLVSLQKMFQLMSTFQQQQSTQNSSWVDIAANVTRDSLPAKPETTKLYSKTPSALEAGKTINKRQLQTQLGVETDNIEPQLPSFEEEEAVVNDLLSLADIDDDSPEEQPVGEREQQEQGQGQGDWGEWLEEEPEVKPEVFNLKSLNIKESQNWKSWDSSSSAGE
ncbi:hypothetical protein I4641_05975 [Waterburya agarophytonicola K14]|uniref:Uncharacterized protein n=1 Tax=Waterburya agarophytonicola KI4 TaxID=2874699 RepID=A0A964BPP6_9CYAN|nr:hypothetical protein [Waterburya agarophytonicola]MCC0176526.1 hypothetical protein [Waterburya agarophytonicola KI4]